MTLISLICTDSRHPFPLFLSVLISGEIFWYVRGSKTRAIAIALQFLTSNRFQQIENPLRVWARQRRLTIHACPNRDHFGLGSFAGMHTNTQKDRIGFAGAVARESDIAQAPGNHRVFATLDWTDRMCSVSGNHLRARLIRDLDGAAQFGAWKIRGWTGDMKRRDQHVSLCAGSFEVSGKRCGNTVGEIVRRDPDREIAYVKNCCPSGTAGGQNATLSQD
jgi:hypothetical protein